MVLLKDRYYEFESEIVPEKKKQMMTGTSNSIFLYNLYLWITKQYITINVKHNHCDTYPFVDLTDTALRLIIAGDVFVQGDRQNSSTSDEDTTIIDAVWNYINYYIILAYKCNHFLCWKQHKKSWMRDNFDAPSIIPNIISSYTISPSSIS